MTKSKRKPQPHPRIEAKTPKQPPSFLTWVFLGLLFTIATFSIRKSLITANDTLPSIYPESESALVEQGTILTSEADIRQKEAELENNIQAKISKYKLLIDQLGPQLATLNSSVVDVERRLDELMTAEHGRKIATDPKYVAQFYQWQNQEHPLRAWKRDLKSHQIEFEAHRQTSDDSTENKVPPSNTALQELKHLQSKLDALESSIAQLGDYLSQMIANTSATSGQRTLEEALLAFSANLAEEKAQIVAEAVQREHQASAAKEAEISARYEREIAAKRREQLEIKLHQQAAAETRKALELEAKNPVLWQRYQVFFAPGRFPFSEQSLRSDWSFETARPLKSGPASYQGLVTAEITSDIHQFHWALSGSPIHNYQLNDRPGKWPPIRRYEANKKVGPYFREFAKYAEVWRDIGWLAP